MHYQLQPLCNPTPYFFPLSPSPDVALNYVLDAGMIPIEFFLSHISLSLPTHVYLPTNVYLITSTYPFKSI